MKTLKLLVFCFPVILLASLPFPVFSQYFTIGTDPGSVRWNIIKTPHFKVIYPDNFKEYSQYMANAMEYIYQPDTRTLGSHPLKTPLILHTRTTVANALTPYAPRRIEFLTTPSQDIYAQNWLDQLMLHEFRHSGQYAGIDRGFTRVLSYIFGQQAVPGILGLFVPFWFIEGDAVVTETALSQSGRGRVPSFEMRLRAQFLQKKIFSYDKQVNGSYKDLIPDRYELGYQLVAMTREQYGANVWGNVLKNVGQYPFMVVPFSASLKHQTGMGKRKLYRSLALKLQEKWSRVDVLIIPDSLTILNPLKRKSYTSYKLPVPAINGNIVAERASLNDHTRIVLLDKSGKEEKLFTCGAGYQFESLSASGKWLFWSEQTQDPRWALRDYRVIKACDLMTGKVVQLTHRTRLFAPSASPDGKKLAAVEIPADNRIALVILDAQNGNDLKRITTPDNLLFIHPSWSGDSKNIVAVVLGNKGNSIVMVNAEDGKIRPLLPFMNYVLKRPVFYHNILLFTASFTGIENIFALDPVTGKLFRVTNSRFGATDPAVDSLHGILVYSDYSADGYNVVSRNIDPAKWMLYEIPSESPFKLADTLSMQEHFVFTRDSVSTHQYPTRRYYKGLHLFDFHSWAPLNVDVSTIQVQPGVTLLSQNLLSSSTLQAGYSYNMNEEAGKYSLTWTYEGLYPVFALSADYGLRRTVYQLGNSRVLPVKWDELNISGAVRIPLNWTHGQWYRGITPRIGAAWKNINHDLYVGNGSVIDRNFYTLDYSFYAYNECQMSLRDIYPSFGQIAVVNYNHSPFNNYPSSIFAAEGYLYFPGIFKHHGIFLYSGFQERHETFYSFSDYITYPRGFTDIYHDQVMTISLNYALPLFYPDWKIGPVLYIKRFKTTLFYDRAWFVEMPVSFISSAGMDLTADFHLFGHFIPLEAGLRSVYQPENKQILFQFLFHMNLAGL